jgi:hypothetical protein
MRASLLMIMALSIGCHAKFKRAAPYIDDINVQVITTGGPYVQLGQVWSSPDSGNPNVNLVGEIAAAAINITQEIRSIDQTDRIYNAVDIHDVNASMTAGLAETLGGGPPFGYTEGDADATLQIEVLSYGINVPYLGAPGEFTYSARARMFDVAGQQVYRKNLTCTVGLGDPAAAAMVFGTVNNVRQLNEMSDAEINDAFRNAAAYCGQRFVLKMRQHAG